MCQGTLRRLGVPQAKFERQEVLLLPTADPNGATLGKWRWTVRTLPGQLLCAAFSEAPAGALSILTRGTTEGTLRYFSVA